MFTKNTKFDEEIERHLERLKAYEVGTSDYDKVMDSLERLQEMKESKKFAVNPDTLAVIAGNLAGIVLILNHERLHVVSSKALGFVLRGRV